MELTRGEAEFGTVARSDRGGCMTSVAGAAPTVPRLEHVGRVTQARIALSEWTKFGSPALDPLVVARRRRADHRAPAPRRSRRPPHAGAT